MARAIESNGPKCNLSGLYGNMDTCWLFNIASELCEYLHPLIAAGDILEVYVQHIKYRVDFFKIGFYPKIS